MRAKLITIFFVTFAVFTAVLVWRVDHVMFGDKLEWSEAQSRSQMSAVVHSFEHEVQSFSDLITLSFSEIEMAKKDFAAGKPYSKFQMVAKLLPPNLHDNKKDWQIVSSFFQEKTSVRNWAPSYMTLALKTVKDSDIKLGSSNIYALMDPSRKPYLLVLIHGSGNWYAGLMGSQVFQGMIDRQKGQMSSLFVVNLQGQALAHTTPEYVGSLLTEDPLVAEVLKSSVSSGSGNFRDLKGDWVQGFYEQIGSSNLFTVITTPIASLMKNRQQVRLQLALMGFGLGLVGLAIFVFAYKPEKSGVIPPGLGNTNSGLQVVQAPKAPSRSEFVKVASSLSHELKSPLTSILGHAQLAGHQMMEPKTKEHLDKIEQEARSARDIIQKLLIFAGEDKLTATKVSLDTMANRALKNVEGKILSKGIRLIKNIQVVPAFTMASDLVIRAMENIFLNAIEAMERVPKKEMTVSLHFTEGQIVFSVVDTGEGIAPGDMEKIFDPFFTTRSNSQHVGLGLSTAMGILKECHGQIEVQSEKAKGTTVTVHFKPTEALTLDATPVPEKTLTAPIAVASAPVPPPSSASAVSPHPSPATVPPMNSLLVDRSIEKLIDDVDDEQEDAPVHRSLMDKKVTGVIPDMPAPPVPEFSMAEAVDLSAQTHSGFTSKIDKPKIDFKKKTSKLDQVTVSVRRPGEKL